MGSSCSTGNCEMINDQGHYGMSPKWFSEQEELAVYNSSQQVQFDSPYNDECLMFSAWNGYYDDQYGLIDLNNYTPQMGDFESSALAEYLHHGLSFLAIAAILAALVAWNIMSVGVLAVIGGQEWVVTVLNLISSVFFCFKQYRKQKHAWKQKSRLERRRSHLSHRQLIRQLQVGLMLSMMGNCWAMDVNVAQQIAELAQAGTRAAQAATTVAERVGSKGGMASGMESASKV